MPTTSLYRTNVQVEVNGIQVSGLLHASVATTNSFSADTFSLTFAVDTRKSSDMLFWSSVPSASVTVTAILAAGHDLTQQDLITGMIDTIHLDPIQGTVAVEGRDLSASMIDAYRQQNFVNQTASEIVSTIALCHGLQPIVTVTDGRVGRYYGDGYTKLSLGQFSRFQSDWDLLVQIARQNNFDVFVQGRSLFFQPATMSAGAMIPIGIHDVQSIRIERNLNIATTGSATVQSWNSQDMMAYKTGSAIAADAGAPSGSFEAKPPFLFSGPNYRPDQVDQLAERYAAELGRLTTVLQMDMPWDLSLSPRTVILLTATDSQLDTTYRIDSIERYFSTTSGSRQMIRAAQTETLN
jgi:hypothetical protein